MNKSGFLPELEQKYFVINVEDIFSEIKYILCFGIFRVYPLGIDFEDIRLVHKHPYYPFPYEISPHIYEFDYEKDFIIEQDFKSDEDAITYFQLTYCT